MSLDIFSKIMDMVNNKQWDKSSELPAWLTTRVSTTPESERVNQVLRTAWPVAPTETLIELEGEMLKRNPELITWVSRWKKIVISVTDLNRESVPPIIENVIKLNIQNVCNVILDARMIEWKFFTYKIDWKYYRINVISIEDSEPLVELVIEDQPLVKAPAEDNLLSPVIAFPVEISTSILQSSPIQFEGFTDDWHRVNVTYHLELLNSWNNSVILQNLHRLFLNEKILFWRFFNEFNLWRDPIAWDKLEISIWDYPTISIVIDLIHIEQIHTTFTSHPWDNGKKWGTWWTGKIIKFPSPSNKK